MPSEPAVTTTFTAVDISEIILSFTYRRRKERMQITVHTRVYPHVQVYMF
jgi:hypothetical protein